MLIIGIVRTHQALSYLDLSGQHLLSQDAADNKEPPQNSLVLDLMQACGLSKLKVLKLCTCRLGHQDMDHIRDWLQSGSQDTSTPSLLELDLRDNPTPYPWENFLSSIEGHKSLEKLSLPVTEEWWATLDKEAQAKVVRNLKACPRLEALEPPWLANVDGIRQRLMQRKTEKMQIQMQMPMQLMTAALVIKSYPEVPTNVLGMALQAIAQQLGQNPKRVLPAKLHVPSRPQDVEVRRPAVHDHQPDPQ